MADRRMSHTKDTFEEKNVGISDLVDDRSARSRDPATKRGGLPKPLVVPCRNTQGLRGSEAGSRRLTTGHNARRQDTTRARDRNLKESEGIHTILTGEVGESCSNIRRHVRSGKGGHVRGRKKATVDREPANEDPRRPRSKFTPQTRMKDLKKGRGETDETVSQR